MTRARLKSNRLLIPDAVRGFAIAAVVLFHVFPEIFPWGYLGVDLFFVTSGFLITHSFSQHKHLSWREQIAAFYFRRLFRLGPTYLVFILTCSVVTILFLPFTNMMPYSDAMIRSAFWAGTNHLLNQSFASYFDPQNSLNPYAHLWSICVEIQFYLMFPLFYFASFSKKKWSQKWILPALILLFAGLAQVHALSQPKDVFYLMIYRVWEFLIGIWIYGLFQEKLNPRFDFRWLKGLALFGRSSYSIYLWHFLILVFLRWTWGMESTWIYFLLLAGFSCASYYGLELPSLHWRQAFEKNRMRAVHFFLIVFVVSYVFVDFLIVNRRHLGLSRVDKDSLLQFAALPNQDDSSIKGSFVRIQQLDSGPFSQKFLPKGPASRQKIFIVGDSHAMAYRELAFLFALTLYREVHLHAWPQCGFLYPLTSDMYPNSPCEKFLGQMLQEIQDTASPQDIVIISTIHIPRLSNLMENHSSEDYAAEVKKLKQYIRAGNQNTTLMDLLKRFSELKLRVVVEGAKPVFSSPPVRCWDWFSKNNPICKNGFSEKREFLLDIIEPMDNFLERHFKNFANVKMWRPFPILCPESTCNILGPKQEMLYFDGDHISGYGSQFLYPHLSVWLFKTGWMN